MPFNAAKSPRTKQYRPEIDGLRALAVLPVIFAHAGFSFFSGGFLGVDVFFVISGFLITGILLREIDQGTFSITRFYERRARRILPALFLILAISTLAALLIMLPEDLKKFGQSVFASNIFLSNFYFSGEANYFDTGSKFKPLLHTWSLSVEEQFYILFPWLLFLLARTTRQRIVTVIGALFVSSLLLAQYGAVNYPVFNFFSPLSRAWELLAGSLAACWKVQRGSLSSTYIVRSQVISILSFFSILLSYILFSETTPNPSFLTLFAVLGSVGIILFAVPGTWVYKLLSNQILVLIGLISYSAYLWHQPVFVFARLYFIEISIFGWFVLILLTLLLAWITWKYVEAPFRDHKKLDQAQIFKLAAAGSAIFIVVGLLLHVTKGLPSRFSSANQSLALAQQDISPLRDTCGNRMPASFDDYCLYGPEDQSLPIAAYLGDSHGKEMFWRLTEFLKQSPLVEQNYRVQPFLWNVCLPFAESTIQKTKDCQEFRIKMKKHILNNPNIKTVIIGANWKLYFLCPDKNNPDKFCDLSDSNYQSIKDEIIAYEDAGKRVILVRQVPVMPWDVHHKLQSLNLSYKTDNSAKNINRLFDDKFEFRSFLRLDPSDYLCSQTNSIECLVSKDEKPLYFDYGHLSGQGADLLIPTLDQKIKTALQDSGDYSN